MKSRLLSVLLVFLLVASAFVPAASAGNPVEDVAKAVGDGANAVANGVKGAFEYTHEVIREVTEVNEMAMTSPEMQDVHVKGAIGAAAGGAAGALAGPGGIVAGAAIGGVANVIDGATKRLGNDTSKR